MKCFSVAGWIFTDSGCPASKLDQHATFICIVNQSVRNDLFWERVTQFLMDTVDVISSENLYFYRVPHFTVDATRTLVQCITCVRRSPLSDIEGQQSIGSYLPNNFLL